MSKMLIWQKWYKKYNVSNDDSKECNYFIYFEHFQIKPDVYSQVIDCHQTDKNGNIMILVGNNYGKG